jgi:hypothetical protein
VFTNCIPNDIANRQVAVFASQRKQRRKGSKGLVAQINTKGEEREEGDKVSSGSTN